MDSQNPASDAATLQESSTAATATTTTTTDSINTMSQYEFERNTIDQYANQQPLVSISEPLDKLRDEYFATSAAPFRRKIASLRPEFSALRRTRPDGNCFFRAFAFAWFEAVCNDPKMYKFARHALELADKNILRAAGFETMVYEDFLEMMCDELRKLHTDVNVRVLEVFNDDGVSNGIVMILRMIAAAYLRLHAEEYMPFVMDQLFNVASEITAVESTIGAVMDAADLPDNADGRKARERAARNAMELYCSRFVECMGQESEQVHIMAVTRALSVPIEVIYIDSSEATNNPTRHIFDGLSEDGTSLAKHGLDASDEGRLAEPLVLLYRPGHYDLLVKG
ncbi:cysteine proteinase [Ramicandelaber brevisporus]|nr:cysteine proteinase [Ramicandelaber brevisporus]